MNRIEYVIVVSLCGCYWVNFYCCKVFYGVDISDLVVYSLVEDLIDIGGWIGID